MTPSSKVGKPIQKEEEEEEEEGEEEGEFEAAEEEEGEKEEEPITTAPIKPAIHPFKCRLSESAAFTITSPDSLIGAGFASLGVGIFTIFRPSPFLLQSLVSHVKTKSVFLKYYKIVGMPCAWLWLAIILLILIGLGFIPLFSEKIRKRGVLLLHPWGLLLMYFDVFVWVSLAVTLQSELIKMGYVDVKSFEQCYRPELFAFIYTECAIYCAGYFFYATYFIAAELTVIERFY